LTLAIKRIHNLPPHFSYASTLSDITQKMEELCCLHLSSVSGSKPVAWLNHSRCSKRRPFAFTHACSHVCDWLRRWCPEEYGPKCQWASASACQCSVLVLCNVR